MASSLPQQRLASASQTATDALANASSNATPSLQNTGTSVPAGSIELDNTQLQALSSNPIDTSSSPVIAAGAGRGSYTGYNASDEVASRETTQITAYKTVTPRPNPLSEHASYTYNLSLHVLTAADYNNMVNNPNNFTITKNLISEANRYDSVRDSNFKDDFYFENLKMTTIIGLNTESRSGNAIDISFTIVEPYGMTLFNRIVDINNTELTSNNYLEMPYLLEITFYGMNDTGNPTVIPNQTKWIPIKLISFKIKASVKGSEYSIQAVPFNHQANFTSAQAIKSNFTVTASTVGEYFLSLLTTEEVNSVDSVREQTTTYNKFNSPDEQRKRELDANAWGSEDTTGTATVPPPTPSRIVTKSFTAAYNYWNLTEVDNGNAGYADQIKFVIDEKISSSSIVDPKKNSIDNAPPTTAKDSARSGPDLSTSVFSLNAGTQIMSIIDMVMQNSDYILSQLNDPATQNKNPNTKQIDAQSLSDLKNGAPVLWYRVVPKIKLEKFDKKRNKWGKTITYYIQPYTYHNNRHPAAPKTTPPGAVKDYQYFYTGQNTEVINFDIEFNALYYTAIQVNKGNTTKLNISPRDDDGKDNGKLEAQDTSIQPTQSEMISGDQSTTGLNSETRSVAQNAGAVIQSFYTNAKGDMINLKLNILGDPEFIKQDDIFYNPGFLKLTYKDQYLPNGGSLAMDNSEIFSNVTFKTPVDIDENTGLLRKDSKYSVSYFSGYYKVIKVDSEFRAGKFLQTLDLIRYPGQPNSGQVSKGWDTQPNDANRKLTAKNTQTQVSDSSQVSGSNIEDIPDPVEVSQGTEPTNDDNVSEVERQSVIDPYEQIPADTSADTQNLRAVVTGGTTRDIGDNAYSDGSVIV